MIALAISSILGDRRSRGRAAAAICGLAFAELVLLAALSLPGALQRGDARAGRRDSPVTRQDVPTAASQLLWLPHQFSVAGHTCSVVETASIGGAAPRALGIDRPVPLGGVLLSPWLRSFITSGAGADYRGRVPGRVIGSLGYQALRAPDECAAVVGVVPAALRQAQAPAVAAFVPPPSSGTTPERMAVIFAAACAIGFPVFLFMLASARIGAVRRTARYAGLSLAGATPMQIAWLVGVEWSLLGIAGSAAGIGLAVAAKHGIGSLTAGPISLYTADLAPPSWVVLVAGAAIPLVSLAAGFASLRSVIVSPLGISRGATSHQPLRRRLFVVVLPVAIITATYVLGPTASPALRLTGVGLGLLALMLGLTVVGPLAARMLATWATQAESASASLAGHRTRYDPARSFRPIAAVTAFVAVVIAIGSVGDRAQSASVPMNEPGSMTAIIDSSGGLEGDATSQLLSSAGGSPLGVLSGWTTDSLRAQHLPAITGCDSIKRLATPVGRTGTACGGAYVPADSPVAVGTHLPLSIGGDAQHRQVDPLVVGRLKLNLAEVGGVPAVIPVSLVPRAILKDARVHVIVLPPPSSRAAYETLSGMVETTDPLAVVATASYTDDLTGSREHTFSSIAQFILILVLIVASGSLLVALADSLDERRAAFTRLLAIGTPARVLHLSLMIETAAPLVVMAGFAALAGMATAAALASPAHLRFGFPPHNVAILALILVAAVALSGLAAAIGVWQGIRPEALREE
jgi:hypothetical protein